MTEAEIGELAAVWAEVGMEGISMYMTVVTGYLLVAYNAGAKLTGGQVHFISATFILFATFGIWATVSFGIGMRNLMDLGLNFYQPPQWVKPAPVIASLQVIGIFGSLIFMYNHRKNELKKEDK